MEKTEKIILGIDPGTRITGYGIIKVEGPKLILLDFGCVKPPPNAPLPERYLALFTGLQQIIEQYTPTDVAIETQFVYKNAQSALKLGMARGVLLLAASMRSIPIFEYTPKKAKLAVVGNGSASKNQVQKMIQLLLQLPILPEPEDAADALALAICHANNLKHSEILCTHT